MLNKETRSQIKQVIKESARRVVEASKDDDEGYVDFKKDELVTDSRGNKYRVVKDVRRGVQLNVSRVSDGKSTTLKASEVNKIQEDDNLDDVKKQALKKKFKKRKDKDKDIDNDGDVDSSDKYLHKRRKAIAKNVEESEITEELKNGTKVQIKPRNPSANIRKYVNKTGTIVDCRKQSGGYAYEVKTPDGSIIDLRDIDVKKA